MDYRKELEKENSKQIWQAIVNDVGNSSDKLELAMAFFFSNEIELVKRISQSIGVIGEKQPQLIKPYLKNMVKMLNKQPIVSVKRNVLRIFQFVNIPKNIEGELFEICYNFLISNDEPKATRIFSMTILRKICEVYPELTNEVIAVLKIVLAENNSPGIQSRGKKELKALHQING